MVKPTSNDRLIDLIYCGATEPAALEEALVGITDLFHCQTGALVLFDQRTPAASVAVSSGGAWNSDVDRQYRKISHLDPAPAAFAQLEPGTVTTTSRMLPRNALREGVFLNEFYYPLGFAESMGASLFAGQSRIALLGLVRGKDRAAFEDRELRDLKGFVPHLARGIQLRRAFIELDARAAAFQDVLERLKTGIVILDQSGLAVFVNRAARTVFGRGDGFTLSGMGRPVPGQTTARGKLDELIYATCRGGPGGVLAVPTTQVGSAYAVLVAPLASNMGALFGSSLTRSSAVLLIHDPQSRSRDAAAILQAALGLKSGAAKLAAALAGDDDLQSYAEREGISINTVRFHLRSALAQTQTRTQAELVRLVVRLLRDIALRAES